MSLKDLITRVRRWEAISREMAFLSSFKELTWYQWFSVISWRYPIIEQLHFFFFFWGWETMFNFIKHHTLFPIPLFPSLLLLFNCYSSNKNEYVRFASYGVRVMWWGLESGEGWNNIGYKLIMVDSEWQAHGGSLHFSICLKFSVMKFLT